MLCTVRSYNHILLTQKGVKSKTKGDTTMLTKHSIQITCDSLTFMHYASYI